MDDKQLGVIKLAALMVTMSEYFAYYQEELFKGAQFVVDKKFNLSKVTPLNKKVVTKMAEKELLEFKDEIWNLRKRLFKIESALVKSLDQDTVDGYIEKLHTVLENLDILNKDEDE